MKVKLFERICAGAMLFLLLLFVIAYAGGRVKNNSEDYGVFLGINEADADRLKKYSLVVIEPSEFSVEELDRLHADGKTVYGYLNIGAIEKTRPYYERFESLSLGRYEDWPDEYWMDTGSALWQSFIIEELGKSYAAMGLDGFFLDNADVYYFYPEERLFNGLCTILRGLRKYKLKLIINGADSFVSRCIEEKTATSLFDGVNQESVFSSIDFENMSYGRRTEEDSAYFKSYLSGIKEQGFSVYLLEYRADRTLSREIDAYCRENGFIWYNAPGLELD